MRGILHGEGPGVRLHVLGVGLHYANYAAALATLGALKVLAARAAQGGIFSRKPGGGPSLALSLARRRYHFFNLLCEEAKAHAYFLLT